MENRVKAKDLPEIKRQLILRQKGICPLCHNDMTKMQSVNICVDHCHSTGRIRAALCRGCNGAEGKIKNLAIRFGKTRDFAVFVSRLVQYWLYHKQARTEWIHPKHKDTSELAEQKKKKARAAYAKKKAALASREASLKRRLKGVG